MTTMHDLFRAGGSAVAKDDLRHYLAGPVHNLQGYGSGADIASGLVDATGALAAADGVATSLGGAILVPEGEYLLSSNLTVNAPVIFLGGRLAPAAGRTLTLARGCFAGDWAAFGGAGAVKIKGIVSSTWFGPARDYDPASGSGAADDAPLARALAALLPKGELVLEHGSYKLTQRLTLTGLDGFRITMLGELCPHAAVWNVTSPYGVLELDNCDNGVVVPNVYQPTQARFGNGHGVVLKACEGVKIDGGRIWTPAYAVTTSGKAAVKIYDGCRDVQVIGTRTRHLSGVFVGGGVHEPAALGCHDIIVQGVHHTGNAGDGRNEGLGVSVDSPYSRSYRVKISECRAEALGNAAGTCLAYAVSCADGVDIWANSADNVREMLHFEDGARKCAAWRNQGTAIHVAAVTVAPGLFAVDTHIPQDIDIHHNEFESDKSTFTYGASVSASGSDVIPGIRITDNKVRRTGTGEGYAAWQLNRCERSECARNEDYGSFQYGTLGVAVGAGNLTLDGNRHFGTYSQFPERLNASGTLCSVRLGVTGALGDQAALSLADPELLVLGAPIRVEGSAATGGGAWATMRQFKIPPGWFRGNRAVRAEFHGQVYAAAAQSNQVRVQLTDGTLTVVLFTSTVATLEPEPGYGAWDWWLGLRSIFRDVDNTPRTAVIGSWNGQPVAKSMAEGTGLNVAQTLTLQVQGKSASANGVLTQVSEAELR